LQSFSEISRNFAKNRRLGLFAHSRRKTNNETGILKEYESVDFAAVIENAGPRSQSYDFVINNYNADVVARVARWFIFKPKITFCVKFGGPWNGKCFYIL
jgi:hypothetical protein